MPLEANRYSCQLKLPSFGKSAQAKLTAAKVLIVGVGGLGCPAAQYLAAAGIGSLALLDDDVVSSGNLHRQILFTEHDLGQHKATVAAKRLKQQNSEISVASMTERITSDNAMEAIAAYDLVLDCTDNFDTRYLLNDACVLAGKPMVYGAAYQYEGQVAIWNAPLADGRRSANYRDVFPSAGGIMTDCATGGVLPTLTGVVGCLQASEAIKYLAGLPEQLVNKLYIFDIRSVSGYTVQLPTVTQADISQLAAPAGTDIPTISADELQRDIDKYLLIDVRTPEEHTEYDIGGRLVPIDELLSGTVELPIAKPIVFYCVSGARSQAATSYFLSRHPNIEAWSLDGGIQAWSGASINL